MFEQQTASFGARRPFAMLAIIGGGTILLIIAGALLLRAATPTRYSVVVTAPDPGAAVAPFPPAKKGATRLFVTRGSNPRTFAFSVQREVERHAARRGSPGRFSWEDIEGEYRVALEAPRGFRLSPAEFTLHKRSEVAVTIEVANEAPDGEHFITVRGSSAAGATVYPETQVSVVLQCGWGAGAAPAAAGVREVIGHMGSCADRPGNTLASIRRAAESGAHAAEADVRTTKDGALVCLHDDTVDRTTDGKGRVADLTLAEVKKLDAGSKFDAKFRGEPVPTLREVLELAKGKIGVMLDLKEDSEEYAKKIAAEVRAFGEPARLVLGVRSVAVAKLFRDLLPEARQIGLVPTADDIEPFAKSGVKVIRLWPKWLADEALVPKVRGLGCELHIGAGNGTKAEVAPLLTHKPESLSSDDPAQLVRTLAELRGPKK
ncbi:MAG: glycerophosphodiester phosphodiesterase [Gemmata sp.]